MRSSPRSLAWAFALAACGEPATVVPADGGSHPDASASTDLPAPMDAGLPEVGADVPTRDAAWRGSW